MNLLLNEQCFYIKNKSLLYISGAALIEILNSVIEKQKEFKFKAKGYSMNPFIKNKDIITISPIKNKKISLGNVVAYNNPLKQRLIVHRVIGEKNGYYLIKGDNSKVPDRDIMRDNIIGTVTKIERKGKNISFGLGWEKYLLIIINRYNIYYRIKQLSRKFNDFIGINKIDNKYKNY